MARDKQFRCWRMHLPVRGRCNTPSNLSRMDEVDFVVTDYVQAHEMWAVTARRTGVEIDAVIRTANLYSAAILVPVCGKAVQRTGTAGFDPDGFMAKSGSFRIKALEHLERAEVCGWLPEQHGAEVEVIFRSCGASVAGCAQPGEFFLLGLPLDVAAEAEAEVQIELSSSFQPSALPGGSSDTRHLGCLVQFVRFS